jgi:hypothetical protein
MAEFFGFEIKRKQEKEIPTVVAPSLDDGSTVVNSAAAYYGMVLDMDSIVKNENDLIKRYREVAQYPDVDGAIEDIVNEAIVAEEYTLPVDIVLDDLEVSAGIKTKIRNEFLTVLDLLDFQSRSHDIFRNWYIDGRLYYHIMIDPKEVKKGIQELRYIDPRKIRRIKNIEREKNAQGVEVIKKIDEYYLYNDKGISSNTTQGIKMPLDSILHCHSGNVDANTGMVLSYLHKAIKVTNQLKMIEDALVIYRITRAPERRIFYIDVGNLPKQRAEQYVNDIMNKFRNKIQYDATTGEVRDSRQHMSMMEDFWMPRREGGKGTEITTLPGGTNLGEVQDIEYFQKKLYHALNVPASRLESNGGFNLGKTSEITRDEVKFNKFIQRIRKRFASLFVDALKVQLVSKNIVSIDDWEKLAKKVKFTFHKDNYFAELKDTEILMNRINIVSQLEQNQMVGKYYSMEWVRRNVLYMTDKDIEELESQIEQEEEMHLAHAERKGLIAGTAQAAQQNYLQQNAPEAQEAPTNDEGEPQ